MKEVTFRLFPELRLEESGDTRPLDLGRVSIAGFTDIPTHHYERDVWPHPLFLLDGEEAPAPPKAKVDGTHFYWTFYENTLKPRPSEFSKIVKENGRYIVNRPADAHEGVIINAYMFAKPVAYNQQKFDNAVREFEELLDPN